MPQWVHDVASVLQIVIAGAATMGLVVGYVWRQDLAQWLADRLQGIPLEVRGDAPAMSMAQIKRLVVSFGPPMAEPAKAWVSQALEATRAIRQKADPAARTSYTLDWRSFFRQGGGQWEVCASGVAQRLLNDGHDGITHVVVLSWPRDDATTLYESFTRHLVRLLGGQSSIRVDHLSQKQIDQGRPLPQFEGVSEPKVVLFEPLEVADGFLERAVHYLEQIHGCNIRAVVTFFRTTGDGERATCQSRNISELGLVNLNLSS